MASDHWRDLHRVAGRFKPRPGGKVFKQAEEPVPGGQDKPPEDKPEGSAAPMNLALFAERAGKKK